MASITEWVKSDGSIQAYQVRVERRGTGKVSKAFHQKAEAEAFLMEFIKEHPARSDNHLGDEINYIKRPYIRSGTQTVWQDTVEINGCRIAPAMGRCEPMDRCEHYWRCLDEADRRRWPGWRRM